MEAGPHRWCWLEGQGEADKTRSLLLTSPVALLGSRCGQLGGSHEKMMRGWERTQRWRGGAGDEEVRNRGCK